MVISMLMSNEELCGAIEAERLGEVMNLLDWLEEFQNEYILPEEGLERLYDLLYRDRRNEDCVSLSRMLERTHAGGRQRVTFHEERFQKEMREIKAVIQEEPKRLREALGERSTFHFEDYRIYLGKESALRSIRSAKELWDVLILFGYSVVPERGFVEYLKKVYRELWFDSDMENSMRHLEAGLWMRKKEILYHLFCIASEIPQIMKISGGLSNQQIGERMSVPCSPERSRRVVEKYLTKEADCGSFSCELHTKMKTIGSRKPDRIYFCASVPAGITIDGRKAEGAIYIYKITKHVDNK